MVNYIELVAKFISSCGIINDRETIISKSIELKFVEISWVFRLNHPHDPQSNNMVQ